MSCVHYKFSSKLDYNTVTFDGLHITLSELKRQIMGRERLKATDCDLQITNAQTREGMLSADALHKCLTYLSVIVFFFRVTRIHTVHAGLVLMIDSNESV